MSAALGAVASYLVAATTTGWVDGWLIAIDRAMGFDWQAAYRGIAARPLPGLIGEIAYLSIFMSPPVVLTALVWTHRVARARALIVARSVALAILLFIFWWMPALSALMALIGNGFGYMPATGVDHVAGFCRVFGVRIPGCPVGSIP